MSAPALRRLTRAARTSLPGPVQRGGRAAAVAWGMLTADARMLPELVITGAQRSGTTTLFRVLADHPDVLRPTFWKGVGYFDLGHHRGLRWYRGHFPLRITARIRVGRGGRPVTFESAGYYSFHPLAAYRIAQELPEARLVYMVRNPVDRAYSAHRHELMRGFETEDFETALALESERLDGEEERILRNPRYESFSHRHHAYLARSRYSEQLRRMQEAVGPARVLVMDADRFFAEPREEFGRLAAWAGLRDWVPESVEQWNARSRDPLPAELRARLMEYFEPYDAELATLIGRTPSWRE